MDQDDAVRLMYASKYAQVANYWKNRQGMIDALTAHKIAQTKRETEKKFEKWAKKKANRSEYGNVLKDIYSYFNLTNEKEKHDNYLFAMLRTSNYAGASRSLGKSLIQYAEATPENRQQMKPFLQKSMDEFFTEVHNPVEKEVLKNQLKLYATKSNHPIQSDIKAIAQANNNDFSNYVNDLFTNSVFTSKEKVDAFLENPDAETIKNDGLYQLSNQVIGQYLQKSPEIEAAEEAYGKAYRKFVKGLRESKLSAIQYPDANSTLRLTYGTVSALPADKRNDATINNYTTFKGMVAKYKPNDLEFDMPKGMITMYENKDFGRYADKDGSMHINFLTNNDITGGNSGSPVMNGKGELIGLAFDGNIEAMAGDVIFDKELQRTINVDIRYVLWLIDKFAGAKHIVDEMTIVE